jgi:hypothetical protein
MDHPQTAKIGLRESEKRKADKTLSERVAWMEKRSHITELHAEVT